MVFLFGKTQFTQRKTDMKKKHGVLFGFAVLLITAIFVLAGCGDSDSGNNTGSGNNPGTDVSFEEFYTKLAALSAGNPDNTALSTVQLGSGSKNISSGKSIANITGVNTTGIYRGWEGASAEIWSWCGPGRT
jgi:hypothetical protein